MSAPFAADPRAVFPPLAGISETDIGVFSKDAGARWILTTPVRCRLTAPYEPHAEEGHDPGDDATQFADAARAVIGGAAIVFAERRWPADP